MLDSIQDALVNDRAAVAIEDSELAGAVIPVESLDAIRFRGLIKILVVVLPGSQVEARALDHAIFADNDWDALVDPLHLDLGHHVVHIGFLRPCTVRILCIRGSPGQAWAAGVQSVVVGIVVVRLNDQAAAGAICGHGEVVQAVPHIRVVGLDDKCAGGVVATCCTHGGHEGLVVRLLHRDVFGGRLAVVLMHLVGAGKEQMFVIGLKVVGDLGPVILLLRVHRYLVCIGDVIFQPAAIPVDVDNDVHVLADGVIDDLLDARQPGWVDRAVGGVAVPGNRDAHRIEPGGLHAVDECLGDHRAAPCGFTALGLERVADVPADTDLTGYLGCRRQGCLCLGRPECEGEHGDHEGHDDCKVKETSVFHDMFSPV